MPTRPLLAALVALAACGPADTDPPDPGPDPVLEQMAADPDWCPDGALSVWLDTYTRARCEALVAAGCTDQTVETCIAHEWRDEQSNGICGDGCDARTCIAFLLSEPECGAEAPMACLTMFIWQDGECHPDADAPRGVLEVSPSPCVLAFGDVAPGSSGSLSVAVANSGPGALYLREVASSGPAFVAHGSRVAIGSGSLYQFGVRFSPTAIGPHTAILTLVTDVATETCALSGRGWRDADGDTYADATVGGDDCADDDAARHPGAADAAGDGVDSDCDGADD